MGTGRGDGLDFGRTWGSLPETIAGQPFVIGRSLGAMALNYDVKDPKTGKRYHFAEGPPFRELKFSPVKERERNFVAKLQKGLPADTVARREIGNM